MVINFKLCVRYASIFTTLCICHNILKRTTTMSLVSLMPDRFGFHDRSTVKKVNLVINYRVIMVETCFKL